MVYPFIQKELDDKLELTIASDFNKIEEIDLPRQKPIQQIGIKVTNTGMDITGSTSFHEDNPMNFIRKIILKVNDTTPVISVSAAGKFYKNYYDYGVMLPNTRVEANTATGFDFHVLLDFRRSLKDKLDQSALFPAHKFNSLKLQFDLGDIVNMYDTVVDRGTTEIRVQLIQTKDVVKKDLWDILYETEHREDIYSSHPSYFPRNLEGMGHLIRRLTLMVHDNSLRSDALLTDVKIKDNKREYEPFVMPFQRIKDFDIEDYKLQPNLDAAGNPVIDPLPATPSTPIGTIKGFANIDFDKNLNFSLWYGTAGYTLGDLQLMYQNGAITGSAYLDYIIEYLRRETLRG